jgi:ATPase subunit of ABC transporter with duplicated ATPase domains
MSHISCSEVSYSHPGGDLLFSGVNFHIGTGQHVGLVGINGVGKTTLLRLIAGELPLDSGDVSVGERFAYMAQSIGVGDDDQTVRELLLSIASEPLRSVGLKLIVAERALANGDETAGIALGEAIADWSELGGYELEASWDRACRVIIRSGLDEVGGRAVSTLSGGERKRLVLELLFSSDADVLLLDEPDNFLDVPAKRALEKQLSSTRKTVLVISHDRVLLTNGVSSILTLEGNGCWMHGGSYSSYPAARQARQERMGDAVKRWKAEERRLFQLVKLFKERARYSSDWAPRANAAESRWRRWVDEGEPPAPIADQQIKIRLPGKDSARKVLTAKDLAIKGLIQPFSEEIYFGERIALIGPNGGGKTSLIQVFSGGQDPDHGTVVIGPRVSLGVFTQMNYRTDFLTRTPLEVIQDRVGAFEKTMSSLARYGLVEAAHRRYDRLSGGQRARLEILCLELEGHNLLLLDEPTDNLDIDSSEALEQALDTFEGTVVAISHDRAFLTKLDRFLYVSHNGEVTLLPDYRSALEALE